MADAEKRLTKLLNRLHGAARGSAAFEGAERDAKRVLEWLQAKSHELESELKKVAHDAGAAAKSLTARKEHGESEEHRASGAPGEPESEEKGKTKAETPFMPDTMGG